MGRSASRSWDSPPAEPCQPHRTEHPLSIQVVQGDVTFFALGQEYTLTAGDILIFGAGVEHSARSEGGAAFLLTVAYVPGSREAERSGEPRA